MNSAHLTLRLHRSGLVPLVPSAQQCLAPDEFLPEQFIQYHYAMRKLFSLVVTIMLSAALPSNATDPMVFISAFTGGEKGAIHAFRLNTGSGKLTPVHRTTDVENPFFMAISRDGRFLYSIHAKQFGGKEDEDVAAYRIDGRSGKLKLLNRQTARGTASCYLEVDPTGSTVLVANYSTGSVGSFPVEKNGALGKMVSFMQHSGSGADPRRQKGPNAHSIIVSPDNRFAFAADLGIDKIMSYRLDPGTAKLKSNQPPFVKTPAGAGPRHLTFHPNGKHLYAINELSNSVTMYDYDSAKGTLTLQQTLSTLPKDYEGRSYCADLKITPDGRHLFGTNRGHDSIARYRIGEDGRLKLLGIEPSLGKGPQNLAITPDGGWLLCANMPGDNVAVFRIDGKTGTLKSVGEPVAMPRPSCIKLLPE